VTADQNGRQDDPSSLTPPDDPIPEPSTPLEPVPVAPVPPPEKRSRAGRNLPAAIGVGAGLGALILLSLYVVKAAFVGVAVVAIVLAVWELSTALGTSEIRVPVLPVLIGAVAILVAAYAGGSEPLVVALVLTALAVMVWRLPDGPEGYLRDVSAGIFCTVYVPFLAGFAMLMLRQDDGPERIVVFVLVTVCSDIGGYAAGVLFGRHPMAPRVSPKKSWEGFAGSAAACAIAGSLTVPLLLDGEWWQGLLLGLATVCTATLGDLGESMIKRDIGIKDMGSILPGHGGLMDRLDSLLPTAPVAFTLLAIFVTQSG
jgi:phosphatidate cytidylyltransferase